MKTISLGKSSLTSSRLAYGCWRIADSEEMGRTVGRAAVLAAVDAGFTLFDHADIYCDGRSESAFGAVLKETPRLRDELLIASKCGIRKDGEPKRSDPFRYDFSKEYIIHSCENSLKRLGIETIDLYQLHRPDWLCNPAEVADALDTLKCSGKVREFGVSNFTPSQVSMLQSACSMPLLVNQVEVSLLCLERFADGTLDQCLTQRITPLAWSPLAGGLLADGAQRLLPWQEEYETYHVHYELDTLAKAKGVTRSAVALAWLLKHPSGIVPIVGSTNVDRIKESARAAEVELSREEWYRLLEAARGERLP